uniref:Eukaryotic translation initiation factor 3 subunit I n=1 Tax=Chromera velia CCMP2878 TaxID=1169474 RepID=A0A0G4G3R4_9ALVE|eukprot:Cvel_20000.t1-p1 / transcript=Cvel_20000.t1 / gene=Cvel_20000 / organism=Chromera_velia_CCMP2878 / gene_product=Eukaryotic translation initiation factor 3 subunit, putative / transcript_product=Eukaryotic translation initiation factor 3 subunit, putative / location=Cvel_scaffold1762:37270-38307(+) / protein_length=346 / sequence_SO=supercontig / SO=protein_coding / is_pseudo=false
MRPILIHAHERPLTFVLFNEDGDLLFTAGKDKGICLYYSKTGEMIGSYEGHNGVVWSLDITKDSKYLVSASADMKVFFWDVTSGETVVEHDMGGPVKFVELCRNPLKQDRILVAQDNFGQRSQKAISIWKVDIQGGKMENELTFSDYPSKAVEVHWGPFDETIVSAHEDGFIRMWDAQTGESKWEQQAHNGPVTNMTFNKDRCIMLTTGADAMAYLWDVVHKKLLKSYKADRPLNAGVISPLAVTSDMQEGEEKGEGSRYPPRYHILLGGGQKAEDVTTSHAQSGKFDALLYHLVFSELLGSIKGGFSPINTLAFIPDGSGFASGAEEGYVRVHHFDDDYFGKKFD